MNPVILIKYNALKERYPFRVLSSKDISVILMTNNLLSIQLKVFQKMGFESYVKTMLTSHEFTFEKPDSESILYILDKFKIQPEEAIVIGDSKSDVEWGSIVGIRSYLCEPKEFSYEFNSTNFLNQILESK